MILILTTRCRDTYRNSFFGDICADSYKSPISEQNLMNKLESGKSNSLANPLSKYLVARLGFEWFYVIVSRMSMKFIWIYEMRTYVQTWNPSSHFNSSKKLLVDLFLLQQRLCKCLLRNHIVQGDTDIWFQVRSYSSKSSWSLNYQQHWKGIASKTLSRNSISK